MQGITDSRSNCENNVYPLPTAPSLSIYIPIHIPKPTHLRRRSPMRIYRIRSLRFEQGPLQSAVGDVVVADQIRKYFMSNQISRERPLRTHSLPRGPLSGAVLWRSTGRSIGVATRPRRSPGVAYGGARGSLWRSQCRARSCQK